MIASPITRRAFLAAVVAVPVAAVTLTATPSPASAGEGPEQDLSTDDAEQDLADFHAFLAHQRQWYGPEYAAWVADTLFEIAHAHAAAGTFDSEPATRELERRFIAQPFVFHDRAHAHLVGAIERHGEPDWLRGRVLRAWPPAVWPPEEWAQ